MTIKHPKVMKSWAKSFQMLSWYEKVAGVRKQVEQSTLALNKALGANCVLFDKPLIKSTELKVL